MENINTIYDKDFLNEVHRKTGMELSVIDMLSKEFKEKIQPEIDNHYLSHLVSSIESIINKERIERFNVQIANNKNIDKDDRQIIIDFISNNRFRFYPILLRKTKGLPLPASIDFMYKDDGQSSGAIIYYAEEITDKKQLRIFMAHELGHIYFEAVSKITIDKDKYRLEDYINLFALFAIVDKDNFYNYKCKEITEDNVYKSIDSILSILSQVYVK
ncbi:hypothetical protein [Brachyspira hampsonii]|uniref:hypothetical protein n=1 Tax=Brachyspira hampsonii TaxID=1287055 RepID=UPI000D37528D|nr:hypothetical protein [Brachyspira hampsonii]PTY39242.1 hypothetical protein DQ06_00985 [Brachyspira hampsonii bv. II]